MLEHLNRFVQYEFFENYRETVDILTVSPAVIYLVLNVEREKIGAIALDTY